MSKDRAAQLIEAGVWLKLSGDREGARKLFERALKLDPGNNKAEQLLSEGPPTDLPTEPPGAPVSAAPPSVPSALAANPFERQSGAPSAAESDWGMATGFSPTPPPELEPSLDSDWGRLTGAVTPIPQVAPLSSPSRPDIGPYMSSSSNVVLGSPSPVPAAPTARAPKTTLQLFTPGKSTAQPAARTISIGGDPGPETPPPSTPPLFGYAPQAPAPPSSPRLGEEVRAAPPPAMTPMNVTIGGDPGEEPEVPSTPPLFAAAPEARPDNEPPLPRSATDPFGHAWSWSASANRLVDAERPLEPRPSPSLAPLAESAWDQRSNPGIKLEAVVGRDRALDLISSDSRLIVSPEKKKGEIAAILNGARDLLELDDHTGAMDLILKAQAIAPDDPDVKAMRERSEKTLLNMFESKLGKIETIPRVLLKDDEIIWLNLDHRAGFVLAQIDGTVSFDDLFSVSGMTRLDTARILVQLVDEGVISRG